MTVGSHYSRGSVGSAGNVTSATSQASSQVDEAYRRLGRRLSIRAHGDPPISRPQRLSRIGLTPSSNFGAYLDHTPSPPMEGKGDGDGVNSNDGLDGSQEVSVCGFVGSWVRVFVRGFSYYSKIVVDQARLG
jgi:hypothetical protein